MSPSVNNWSSEECVDGCWELSDMASFIRYVIPLMQFFGRAPFLAYFTREERPQSVKTAGLSRLAGDYALVLVLSFWTLVSAALRATALLFRARAGGEHTHEQK
jgi:hypothetical protein